VPSAVIRGSNEFIDFGVTEVSKRQNVSHIFHFLIGLILYIYFLHILTFLCHSVTF
jgi:hypothetical protein